MPLFCASAVRTANSGHTQSSALRSEIEITSMQQLDLSARGLGRAAVVDDVVRGFQTRRAIDLRAQHRQRLRASESHRVASIARAASTPGSRRRESDRRARRSSSRRAMARQRARRATASSASLARVRLPNQRMQNRFELPPLRLVLRTRASAAPGGSARRMASTTPGPNSLRLTAAKPGSPRATTSRATTSVSMSVAPSFTNMRAHERLAAGDAAGQADDRDADPGLRCPPCDHCTARAPNALSVRSATTLAERTTPGRAARGVRPTVER